MLYEPVKAAKVLALARRVRARIESLPDRRVQLPRVEDKLNAGQKVVGGLLILLSGVEAVTGLLRWPFTRVPAAVVERADAVHEVVFPVLLLLFLGHVFIASGIHPEFHGVWRAMLANGFIPVHLARAHWTGWRGPSAA